MLSFDWVINKVNHLYHNNNTKVGEQNAFACLATLQFSQKFAVFYYVVLHWNCITVVIKNNDHYNMHWWRTSFHLGFLVFEFRGSARYYGHRKDWSKIDETQQHLDTSSEIREPQYWLNDWRTYGLKMNLITDNYYADNNCVDTKCICGCTKATMDA